MEIGIINNDANQILLLVGYPKMPSVDQKNLIKELVNEINELTLEKEL